MLQPSRLADRVDLQPVKLSRPCAQSRGFFQVSHTGLHGREGTSRCCEASTQNNGEGLQ